MDEISTEQLRETVLGAIKAASRSKLVTDVGIEVDVDDYGREFLRVVVYLSSLEKASDDELERVLESIEGAVLARDRRYPSVRFSEAA